MCGFIGYFSHEKIDLKASAKSIIHRGPDQQNISEGADWKIAFNRLSIIDKSNNAMQPFSYDGVKVFVNGEIYNYLELRKMYSKSYNCKTKSDVEIIPYLYRLKGINFLKEINGMFSMVIIDEKLKLNYLIRDRFGKKPLFYVKKNDSLFFSSEIKALKYLLKLKLSKSNLATYMSSGFLFEPLTSYENVFSILPGSYIKFEKSQLNEVQWYKPVIKQNNFDKKEIKKNFLQIFDQSIDFRLRSDVPVGIFLSGGLDSNLILRNAIKKYPNLVSVICEIPQKEKIANNFTDVKKPENICKENNYKFIKTKFDFEYLNNNLIKIISKYDHPILNSGILIFYRLAELAKENGIKVVLSGIGGDEIFGGYPWQDKLRIRNMVLKMKFFNKSQKNKKFFKISLIPNFLLNISKRFKRLLELIFEPHLWLMKCFGSDFQYPMNDMKNNIHAKLNELSKKYYLITNNFFDKKKYNFINYQNIYYSLSLQNYFSDQMCMMHSVENRAPLLDFKLFEFMMTVPEKYKISKGSKKLQRDICKYILPDYILNSPKSGPSLPLNIWLENNALKKDLFNYIQKNLYIIENNISKDLAKSLKNYKNVFTKSNISLFQIISFLIWYKIHIEGTIKSFDVSLSNLVKS